MKKLLSIMLAVMCVFCSFCFVGCQKTGPIPNGKYAMKLGTDYSYYSEEKHLDNYWEIKGDTATEYVSSAASYKAKIVEKDGVIYFEGYKWKDFFTSIELGSENDYTVEYNAERKSIKTSFIITDAIPNVEISNEE